MFSKADVIFESSHFIAEKALQIDKQVILESVHRVAADILQELQIHSLNKIIIKNLNLFDNVLGTARMNSMNSSIALSFEAAIQLSDIDNEMYQEGLSVLYHEMYHIKDYEIMGSSLLNHASNNSVIETGYDLWTEFFATYSSFNVYEAECVYDSFDTCFLTWDSPLENKKYFLSHLMGYYLNSEHSSRCEQLINKHLCKKHVQRLSTHITDMLKQYPSVSMTKFEELEILISKVATTKYDIAECREISIQELLNSARRK